MFSTNSIKRFEEKISFFVLFFSWFDHTLQIPNFHYDKKTPLKTDKNLLGLSKSLFVTIAKTSDSPRFSVSQKVFSASKFWLILSKNFLDLGMEFVYEKMAIYKIVSPRKPIFSMIIFS